MVPPHYSLFAYSSAFRTAPLYHCSETGSTMDDARSLPAQTADGTVLWADLQHAGRGRGAGRNWHARAGENLLLTLTVSRTAATPAGRQSEIGSIPLRAGLAVARTAVVLGVAQSDVDIKWPNDVLVCGRKLCGVLCEGVSGRYHIGIGLNVNQTDFSELQAESGPAADRASPPGPTSLALATGHTLDRLTVFYSLLSCLETSLRDPAWRSAVNGRLYRRGLTAGLRCGGGPAAHVQILGVAADGTLEVLRGDGSRVTLLQPDELIYTR